MTGKFFV